MRLFYEHIVVRTEKTLLVAEGKREESLMEEKGRNKGDWDTSTRVGRQ